MCSITEMGRLYPCQKCLKVECKEEIEETPLLQSLTDASSQTNLRNFDQMWFKTKPPKYKLGQWISTVVGIYPASFCFFSSGMAMAWTSPAFAKIKNKKVDFSLEQYEMSLIAALPFAGRFFSPIPMSYVMDYIGRKACLVVGRLLQMIHWIMIYFSHNIWVLYLARLINGWYSGMALFVLPVYIGETTHKTTRGRAQGVMNVQFLLGIVFESIIGAVVSYDNLVLASGTVDLLCLMLMFIVPETPYFYIMKERIDEATASLQWLRGRAEDIAKEFKKIEKNLRRQLVKKSKYVEIFTVKSHRKGFIIAVTLLIFQRTSGMTAIIPYGSFIVPNTPWLPQEKGPILLNSTYLVMCAMSGYFIDSWGRKKFLVLSSTGTCIFMIGIAIWFYLQHSPSYDVSGTEWLVVSFLVLQAAFYSTGYFYIPTLVLSEMFPMNIKAKASALGAMTAVAVSTIVVYIFLPITNTFGLYVNFIIYSVSNLLGAIYSTTIIETKGKSLEGIQAMLEGRPYTSESTIGLPNSDEE